MWRVFLISLWLRPISFLWQCRYLVCHLWKASPQTLSYSQRRQLISVWFQDVMMCLIAVQELLNQSVDRSFTMTPSSKPDTSAQHNEYAREVHSMGLLLMEFVDSIQEGDGIRCWRMFLPIFKATIGRTIPSRCSPCLLNVILFLHWGWSNGGCGKEHSMWLIHGAPELWVCVH